MSRLERATDILKADSWKQNRLIEENSVFSSLSLWTGLILKQVEDRVLDLSAHGSGSQKKNFQIWTTYPRQMSVAFGQKSLGCITDSS